MIRLAHATGHDRHTYELVESCEGDLSGRDLDLLTELLMLAQDSCTRLDDPLPEAFVNNTLGLRYMEQRDDCERAVLDTLAGIEASRGRYDEALSCHLESVRLHRELGFPWGEAVVLKNLGHTYHAIGRTAEANAAWQEALTICDRIHAPRSEDLDREQLVALLSQA